MKTLIAFIFHHSDSLTLALFFGRFFVLILPEWFELGLLKEIFVAIVGGATTMTVVKTREHIENSRLTREYPVAGSYITRFEDEAKEGTKVWVTAPATLKQRGLSVTGSTKFDKRVWIIDARISKDGYLTGTYKAQDPYDKGFGNLFLRIDSDGMTGNWSGFDSQNKRILSGQYVFRKKTEATFGPVVKERIPALLSIAEKQLGDSYIKVEDFTDPARLVYEAVSEKKAIGFITGKTLSLEDFQATLPKASEALSRRISVSRTIGMVGSIAVESPSVGTGVGYGLMGVLLDELDRKSCETILMLGWKRKGASRPEIAGLAERYGFEAVRDFPEYWKDESQKLGYRCPSCGDPPCLCDAVLFVRHKPCKVS
ncbi:MAG: hypothetical protein ACYDBP_08580 [Leptospirales bacterium]